MLPFHPKFQNLRDRLKMPTWHRHKATIAEGWSSFNHRWLVDQYDSIKIVVGCAKSQCSICATVRLRAYFRLLLFTLKIKLSSSPSFGGESGLGKTLCGTRTSRSAAEASFGAGLRATVSSARKSLSRTWQGCEPNSSTPNGVRMKYSARSWNLQRYITNSHRQRRRGRSALIEEPLAWGIPDFCNATTASTIHGGRACYRRLAQTYCSYLR